MLGRVVLLACITSCLGDSGTLYKRTLDMSAQTFKLYTNKTVKARSSLNCAHQCLFYKNLDGNCNAYSYKGEECTLANVEYLEDPEPDCDEQEIFIDLSAKAGMVTKCRGGEKCCVVDI